MSTEVTEGSRLLTAEPAVSDPGLAPEPALNGNGHGHIFRGHLLAERVESWRDPSGSDLFRSKIAVAASGVSLAVMVVASLLLVSFASASGKALVPVWKPGYYPRWIAGPLGSLTSWALTASSHTERVTLTVTVAAMLVAYLVVVFSSRRLRLGFVVATVVAVHVIFLLAPPLTLTDVFNYLNYGRMEAVHHLNPYTTLPALEPHNDPTFALSNWHGLLDPYGPLFTLFAAALVPLGVASSFWAMKAALMLASLATVFLVYRCATLLGRNAVAAVAIVGMNPIVLVWGLGGDHNDFLMMFFLVFAFWLLLRADSMRVGRNARPAPRGQRGPVQLVRRGWAWLDGMPRPLVAGEPAAWMEILAGVSLVAAVAIKASSAVLVPVILAGASRRLRVLAGVILGSAAAAVMTYIAFGFNLPNIGQQSALVVPDGIPNLTGLALGFGGATSEMRQVLFVLLVAVIVVMTIWTWRTRRWLTSSGWVTLALLLTLSWTLPWYVAWLLPFAALARSRALRVAAAMVGAYMYVVFMPYSSEILVFLHINPATTTLGQQEQTYMNSLLF
ncbi:MAG TPA: hypothetical protein VHX66_05925 [Solirubrobacteraceae bacterium]|jgi:hypothetical protein|nr:hypothetical protein [Solirubrobacteraceae bacterium]